MKLYISDLDGTLLRNNATLSPYSRNTLQGLIKNGVHFTVASARSVVTIKKVMEGVRLKLPVIEFNGAFISDMETGRHSIVNHLDPEIAQEIYALGAGHGIFPFVSSFNGREDCLYYPDELNDGMEWYYQNRLRWADPRLRKPEGTKHIFRDQVVCLTLIHRKEALLSMKDAIMENFAGKVEIHLLENQYSPGWFWLTVHDSKATKDQAIMRLSEEFGYRREDLTVFGDNINDIKMFKYAANSIAVRNAAEELKTYATKIIESNEEDSVVKYILEDNGFSV